MKILDKLELSSFSQPNMAEVEDKSNWLHEHLNIVAFLGELCFQSLINSFPLLNVLYCLSLAAYSLFDNSFQMSVNKKLDAKQDMISIFCSFSFIILYAAINSCIKDDATHQAALIS
jgi:hypothetical protein